MLMGVVADLFNFPAEPCWSLARGLREHRAVFGPIVIVLYVLPPPGDLLCSNLCSEGALYTLGACANQILANHKQKQPERDALDVDGGLIKEFWSNFDSTLF